MPITTFDPQIHGFHFNNNFTNHVIRNIETHGLCGGMAFAALDYYFAGMPIPTHEGPDFPDGLVPAEGSVLRKYIYKRMINTIERNLVQWGNVLLNPVFNAKKFTKRHLDDLRAEIDAGRPAPIGLVGTTKVVGGAAGNHQVVCFGYQMSGNNITLQIYDNNHHDQTVTLTTNAKNPEVISYSTGEDWIAFFLEKYESQRPEYFDLALNQGIQLNLHGPVETINAAATRQHQVDEDGRPVPPSHVTVQFQECGLPMAAHYRVRNFGEYAARIKRLVLKMRDPSGDETLFGANEVTSIAAGSESGAGNNLPTFPDESGGYDLRAEYVNRSGKTIRVPIHGIGTDNDVSFSAVPAGTRSRGIRRSLTVAAQ